MNLSTWISAIWIAIFTIILGFCLTEGKYLLAFIDLLVVIVNVLIFKRDYEHKE